MSLSWVKPESSSMRSSRRFASILLPVLAGLLESCGGGGGSSDGGGSGGSLQDPVIPLVGPTGRYSQTPGEANASLGTNAPPVLPPIAGAGENHYLRLEVPFDVTRSSILSKDPLLAPFSFLNGNITITEEKGNHVSCVVMVNGVDAQGKKRTAEEGFPHETTASGSDLNVGPGIILFVADDGDGKLSTTCAFGGRFNDTDGRTDTTEIKQIRLSVNSLNEHAIRGFYTVTIDDNADGVIGDINKPRVLSVVAETPNPLAPEDTSQADSRTRFYVRFSEPCVPTTTGNSSKLDPAPFDGNFPLLPFPGTPPQPPLPTLYLTAQFNNTSSPLFLPCDVNPLNSNNLSVYVVQPLVDLPPFVDIQVRVVDAAANQDPLTLTPVGPMDLSGNFHQPGSDVIAEFTIGPGRVPVNVPVSPEVVYILPAFGRGLAAIDLNGMGFTTNTPGRNATVRERAALITRPYVVASGSIFLNWNPVAAVGLRAHPPGGPPVSAPHNAYEYPVGTGGFSYGPTDPNTPDWEDPNDPGNPGTPFPGVNEMSSGYETLVRNSAGEILLTGEDFTDVGVLQDAAVGEFLDANIFDTQNVGISRVNHFSFYWPPAIATNSIGEPPIPNPPPLRYWLGLQPIDILIDQSNPGGPARLIEGEEVFVGDKAVFTIPITLNPGPLVGYQWVLPNQTHPLGFDQIPPRQLIPAFAGIGPTVQSCTYITLPYSARQQVGNYLYVTDGENRLLHALNSNTMKVVNSIELPDPVGVTVSADLRFVFVTNSSDSTVSIIGADPTVTDFHTEIARVRVGRGPQAVASQPDGEDVHVGNLFSDSISILSLGSLTIRKELTALISGPTDIVLGPRQNSMGYFSGVYYGYISNTKGNSVLVYESGPSGPQGIGCDNILGELPTEGDSDQIVEPRGMCYCPFANNSGLLASGVFVAHRDPEGRGIISRIENSHQALFGPLPCVLPPGNFYIPQGFTEKIFEITGQWGLQDGNSLLGSKPTSVVLADFRRDHYLLIPPIPINNSDRPFGGIGGLNTKYPVRFLPQTDPRFPHVPANEPDRMYVSFADTDAIQVLDPVRVGTSIGELKERVGRPVKKLVSFFE